MATIRFQFHDQQILVERVTQDTLRNVTVNLSPDRRDPDQLAQRVGMQIAELAIHMRETAFAGAERCLRAAGRDLGVAGPPTR